MPWQQDEGDRIRELIKHESEVLNHRVTWLITLNGLAFAALGFAWKDGSEIVPLLGWLGIAGSVVLTPPIFFADVAIDQLMKLWEKRRDPNYDVPVIGLRASRVWCLVWIAIPIVFIVIWSFVLLAAPARPIS